MDKYKEWIQPVEVPTWHEYFTMMAFLASVKSKDAQTQHGCIIVDPHNHIIGTGYNSFARGSRDDELPNLRPAKYQYMIHAERHALSNLTVSPWLYKLGCTAYITGKPCFDCLQQLWDTNITVIYTYGSYGWLKDAETEEDHDFFIQTHALRISELPKSVRVERFKEFIKELRK